VAGRASRAALESNDGTPFPSTMVNRNNAELFYRA
jgi:hypothetical protein